MPTHDNSKNDRDSAANPLNQSMPESILNSIPDGVYITDRDRRIVFWNRAAEEITGWDAGTVVGKRCHENVLCHIDKDGHLLCGHEHCPLHRSMETDSKSKVPSVIFAQRRDGQRVPVEVMVSPLHNGHGDVIGGIEVFRDLSPTYQDLNRARLIQRQAMGVEIPRDSRLDIHVSYTSHDLVGGDFYRVEALNDHIYAFLIADVVGHGISAALYAMQLRALWEDGRRQLQDPAAFLFWLNSRVQAVTDIDAGYFATAIHAVYDSVTGKLSIGSAGHPAPLIIGPDGSVKAARCKGPGLGLLAKPAYDIDSITLKTGESALFMTDGTYEVTGHDGQDFGEEAFRELAGRIVPSRGSKALHEIEEALLRFSGHLSIPDDLTMILLRRRM